MINRVSPNDCCLCGACVDKCPHKAITLSKVYHLFSYPEIDDTKCISCNLCENVCPVLNNIEQKVPLASFAASSVNENTKMKSSSGGVVPELAKVFLSNNGVVIGAGFDKGFIVKHMLIDEESAIHRIQSSKYVQSNMQGIYSLICEFLKKGINVLFIGCPCQCAGINQYVKGAEFLGVLYTVDFICHGILSEDLFQIYIKTLKKSYGSNVTKFEFRNKSRYGWQKSEVKIQFENGITIYEPYYENTFLKGMLQGICCKESCYKCKFKNFHSGSDITLGDYWGAETIDPSVFDPTGVSIVFVQSEKGHQLFDKASRSLKIKIYPRTVELLTTYNKGLFSPFPKGDNYSTFWNYYEMGKDPISSIEELTKTKLFEHYTQKAKNIIRQLRERYFQ